MASAENSPPPSQLPEPAVVLESPLLGATTITGVEESQIPIASLAPSHSQADRSKFMSPIPDAITPPPSSQPLQVAVTMPAKIPAARTVSPPPTQLTSPPPTSQPSQLGQATPAPLPLDEDIDNASVEELRALVHSLRLDVNEARTAAAHFKLQHNMLIIDSAEAQNRMLVELEMAQREIEVLQQAEERRRQELMSPSSAVAEATTAKAAMLNELSRQRDVLAHENDQLRDMVTQSKKALEYKDGVIASQEEEIERLRRRIRANREHMNGLLDNMYEATSGSPRSHLGTPHRTPGGNGLHSTPRHHPAPRAMMPTSQPRDNQPFEALLLADKVLSQETASATAPSTPKPGPRRAGHIRGVQSLSSLPSTPSRNRQMPGVSSRALQTPPHLSAILEPPAVGQPLGHPQLLSIPRPAFSLATGPGARRRASSDSTITASSVDEEEARIQTRDKQLARAEQIADAMGRQLGHPEEDDEVPESQASQTVRSMLRRTPVEKGGSMHSSFESQPSSQRQQHQQRNLYVGGGGLTQSKLVGKVVKHPRANANPSKFDAEKEKRRLTSYGGDQGSPSKKSRHEGVGLGIVQGSPTK
jgi:hypothetical protein